MTEKLVMNSALASSLKPRNLFLELMLASNDEPLSAKEAVRAAALFGISESNARITLLRLSAEGLITAEERGVYRLSEQAHELADAVALWRGAERRIKPWRGGYLALHRVVAAAPSAKLLRQRQRALDLHGFAPLEPQLYIRPDNRKEPAAELAQRLAKLGLEPNAQLLQVSNIVGRTEADLAALWDAAALNRSYAQLRQQLETWMQRAPRLAPEQAMRESFLLGSKAIRAVLFDPLLPEAWLDAAARKAFFQAVAEYDANGRKIWRRLRQMPDFSARSLRRAGKTTP